MFVQLISDIIYFFAFREILLLFSHNDKLIKDNSYLIEGHSINRGCDNLCYYKMTKHRIECCNWIYEDMLDFRDRAVGCQCRNLQFFFLTGD